MIVHEQQRKVGEEVAQERGRSGGGRRSAGRQAGSKWHIFPFLHTLAGWYSRFSSSERCECRQCSQRRINEQDDGKYALAVIIVYTCSFCINKCSP
jgi:hypothetical protein